MLVAAVAWSSAGLVQRQLEATAATQVLGRALFAFLALLAIVLVQERSRPRSSYWKFGRSDAAVAFFLAISSGTYLLALNYTTVANVLFLQAASPMIAALLSWVILRERVSLRTRLAMVVAAAGVTAMVAGSIDAGVAGTALPVLITVSFAAVIVITRYRREVSMMRAACASQALVVVVAAPFATLGSATAADWGYFFSLGTFQIGAGLALLTVAARLLPSAEVALIALLEVVLGPLWVWLAYTEQPSTATLIGGVIVAAAVILQTTAKDGSGPDRELPATPAPHP